MSAPAVLCTLSLVTGSTIIRLAKNWRTERIGWFTLFAAMTVFLAALMRG